jgi:6-phosphogluconolactonase (cycloisomerase 2 family)
MKRYLWSLSLIGLALLAFAQSLYAADWPCGDVACLINAIKEANGNGEANTITLRAGHYILTTADAATGSGVVVAGTMDIESEDPEHPEDTVLERAPTAPPFRLVYVGQTGNLTVTGVTIKGGKTSDLGGGILSAGASHLRSIDVVGNAARAGGGLATAREGMITLWSTIVAGNTAEETDPGCHGKLSSVISLGNNLTDDPTGCNPTLRADDLNLGADPLSQPSGTGGPAVASSRFAFATSKASGMIFGFTIDASGRMSANGSVAACNGPVGLATDHTRQWLYVACGDKPFEVVVFRIDAAGRLTLQQKVPVSGAPSAVAVAQSNCCLYVTKSLALPVVAGPDQVSFTLQRYMINRSDGQLTFAEEQRTQGADPDAVVQSPQGDYTITANASGNDLMTFRTDPISGQMTVVELTPTGRTPTSLAFTSQGDLLMVGCERDGVYMYALNHSSGHLTLVDHQGSFAAGVGVSPDGASLIATYWDDKTVVAYTIDHTVQKLVRRQIVADTGGEPSTYNGSVMFNDSGTFYVVNIHDQTGYKAGDVQRYTMDSLGKVTAQEYLSAGLQPAALAIAK